MTDHELLERSPPGWDGPPLIIRTYEPRDRDAVWDLHVEGLVDMNTWDGSRDSEWDADVRHVEPHYLVPGSHFWVVESPSPRPATRDPAPPLIATSAVRRHDDTAAEIKRMRVTKAYRRRGIARLLVEIAEDFCRRSGYSSIVLDTTDRQQPAQRLYESLGYTRTGSRWLEPLQTHLRFYAKELG